MLAGAEEFAQLSYKRGADCYIYIPVNIEIFQSITLPHAT